MSQNCAIGFKGQLPWHLPNDLKRFKQITWGKNILMGKKTFDSINRALPGRNNLVMTTDASFSKDGVTPIHSLEELMSLNLDDLFIIGGEHIYRLFLPQCSKIYLTLVHAQIEGDTFFPTLDGFIKSKQEDHPADERHAYGYSFIEYLRT